MKKYLFLGLCIVFAACSGGDNNPNENKTPDIPTNIDTPGEKVSKPIQLWIDAHANFGRLSSKANITNYLERMKETGFNEIYVDVKPGLGYALYESDILPPLIQWGSETVNRDWDYLGFWIEEAERFGIRVYASISTLGFGAAGKTEGLIYDDHRWDGKTQMAMINNDPNNIVDIRTQTGVDAAFLNPCLPEVQSFVISIVEEIATKYPKLKGICLDYCRWYGGNYGFGDATIAAFEAYSGELVTNRNNIITASGGIGPQYKKWMEFRSMTVTNLITNIRSAIKSIHPEMELHLWAMAYWPSCYGSGQNWASKRYIPSESYLYTDTYNTTGFADQVDAFSLGAYVVNVWKADDPGSDWTLENLVTSYSKYTMGDCKVYGSIGPNGYGPNTIAVSDAVYLCLKHTDGLMVFELGHVINHNHWAAIKEGIGRVIK
jgi:uncharacterized lipoprotein YddW (UPF0748 family)